jgi:alpha-glucosidase
MGEPHPPWWQTGVVYQIYPRSFADSNSDGIGDLPGITGHLDYLVDLGIDAIWLSPIYPSPMADFGYDVSDYTAVGAEFGTMADFQTLLAEAHRRGIRLIMDLVLNHTSDQHPWFLEATSSRENPKRDWYVWSDGRPGDPPRPPNNWQASFGGRAWTWHAPTQQFYLHSFTQEQPDVNWRNPELRAAMAEVLRFWLDLGVDGFRLDVVNWFVHDDQLRDNPYKLGRRPYDMQHHLYDRNHPQNIPLMREIRQIVDEYPDRMTIGEVYTEPPGDPQLVTQYYDKGAGLHMAFNFAFLYSPWDARTFADVVETWEGLLGSDLWPNYTLSNHDQPRALSRYARRGDTVARARVAAALLLTLRGTPFLYYGEEIGMQNGRIPRARLQDPVGKRYWPFNPGRDPERTPMQWSAAPYAGFSSVEPWLPVNDDHHDVNVAAQQEQDDSLLHWYRALLRLRRETAVLQQGSYATCQATKDLYIYRRGDGAEQVLVALNFSGKPQPLPLPPAAAWHVLLGYPYDAGQVLDAAELSLVPYGILIMRPAS